MNGRIVVTQILASGAGGGAQSSVRNLVAQLDKSRFDVEVISLSEGPAVRWLCAAGITTHVIDVPDDAAAEAAVLELFRSRPPDIGSTRSHTRSAPAATEFPKYGSPKSCNRIRLPGSEIWIFWK